MKLLTWLMAMSSVAATWALLAAALVGIGLLVRRIWGARSCGVERLFVAFWLGLAITVGGLQIWNLFLPIGVVPICLVIAIGLTGLALSWRDVGRLMIGAMRHRRMTFLSALILTTWLANRALGPADLWDTRMYHINAVRWASDFAAVPGIANLQRNIAFNNANHLLAAMVNVGPWKGRSQHVIAGLLLLSIGLRSVLGMSRLLRNRSRIEDRFFALIFPAIIALAMRAEIASLSSDLPAAVLTFVSVGLMGSWLRRPSDRFLWITILCIFAAAVCCKLSTLGLAGVGFPLVVGLALRHAANPVRTFAVAGVIAISFAVPWMARSAIMSGYPLFPMSIAPLNVDWRYPQDELTKLQEWIRAHGRGESKDLVEASADSHWFGHWTREALTTEIDRTLPTIMLAGIVLAFTLARYAGRGKENRTMWLATIPALSATLLWFATSPAVRFGFAFPWSLAAVAIVWPRRFDRIVPGLVVILCLPCVARSLAVGKHDAGSQIRKLIVLPGPDRGFHPPPPTPFVVTFQSLHGVTMYVPVSGDFCWSAPLPCTHLPNPDLRYRVPGDLSKGFTTKSELSN